MTACRLSQPDIVLALCIALAKLNLTGATLCACVLVEAVAEEYQHVPLPALRVLAAKVLTLYFEPPTLGDIASAGLNTDDEATACEFFAASLQDDIDTLRDLTPRGLPMNKKGHGLFPVQLEFDFEPRDE